MKAIIRILFLILFTLLALRTDAKNISYQQDTSFNYLMNACYDLMRPHSELTYTFGTDELKNEAPDLKTDIPNLKDSLKYLEELKGNYKDWYVFYKIGNLYKRFNQLQSAMNYFNQAYNLIYNEIKKDSLRGEPYSDMGTLYLNLNSNENAFYFFKKAYSLNSKDSLASMFLPMFYIFSGDFQKSEDLVRKRLGYDPKNTSLYIWLITSKIYQQLGKLNQNDSTITNKTIDDLFDLKDITDAAKKYKNDIGFILLEQLSRQLAIFAKYSILPGNFLNSNLKSVDLKEIKNIEKNLLKILDKGSFKNKYILYKSLGFNYLLQKNKEKAIEYFRKTITAWPLDKTSKDYYILFTTQYFIKNDTLASIQVLDEKIKSDETIMLVNASDYVLKGNVQMARRDFINAKSSYQKALQIQQIPEAYLGLAILEIKEHKLQEANKLIIKAYDINKENYLTFALFGIITIMNKQMDESKSALEKAMQLKPDENAIKEIYDTFFKK